MQEESNETLSIVTKWIDYSTVSGDQARISRGKSYFKKGKVLSRTIINKEINDSSVNLIEAVVQGRFKYEVQITLPKIDKDIIKAFIIDISKNKFIFNDLLVNKINQTCLNKAKKYDIDLFPSYLSTSQSGYFTRVNSRYECACQDGYNLCKHIAAVLHSIAEDMSTDISLLFTMAGIDLKQEFKNNNITFKQLDEIKNISLAELLDKYAKLLNNESFKSIIDKSIPTKSKKITKKDNDNDVNNINIENQGIALYKQLNFSKIPYLHPSLWRILPKNPKISNTKICFNEFCDKFMQKVESGVHDELVNLYANTHHNTKEEQEKEQNSTKFKRNKYDDDNIIILPNDAITIKYDISNLNKYTKYGFYDKDNYNHKYDNGIDEPITSSVSHKICFVENLSEYNAMNLDYLFNYFRKVNLEKLDTLHPNTITLYHIWLTSMHLVASGAIFPQVFNPLDELNLVNLWMPLILDKGVSDLINTLANLLPDDALLKIKFTHEKKNTFSTIPKIQQTLFLCSIFTNHIIMQYRKTHKLLVREVENNEFNLFLGNFVASYAAAGNTTNIKNVHKWLSRLDMQNFNFKPIFKVSETNERIDQKQGLCKLDVLIITKYNEKTKEFDLNDDIEISLKDILKNKKYENYHLEIKNTISLFFEFIPDIEQFLKNINSVQIFLDQDGLSKFLFDIAPIMKLFGVKIILPKSLEHLVKPYISMQIKKNKKSTVGATSFLNFDDLFDFSWKVALGNNSISLDEFIELTKKSTGFIKFKDEYIYVTPEDIANIKNNINKEQKLSKFDIMQASLANSFNGQAVNLDNEAREILNKFIDISDINQPKELQAELRPYQQRGYSWLYRNIKLGLGSIIADDMGLGKTLQVITTIQKLKEENSLKNKALVIVPTTLLSNWEKEIQKFAPNLSVDVFHGNKRELNIDVSDKKNIKDNRADITLSTYGIVRSSIEDIQKLKWDLLIIDEAQNIKNINTDQTKAVKSIKANSFIAMSGTPVENRLTEYWSIMDFVNRGYLGTVKNFITNYANPIQTMHDQEVANKFKKITAPFVLRRLKSDKTIINDLPDKIEQNELCYLGKEQASLYEAALQKGLKASQNIDNKFERSALILQMILSLKQICNHPEQFLKDEKYKEQPEISGKMKRLFDLLDEILVNHEKVLIFTQYKEMGDLLSYWIQKKYEKDVLFLNGSTTRANRDKMVDEFNNNLNANIFILSIKAGGTGLNLVSASHVIHYDLWWNPAVEAQATDRAYRIGQKKNVQVHRFITVGTFEEKINAMIEHKKKLADFTVAQGEQWIGNLNNSELGELFSIKK